MREHATTDAGVRAHVDAVADAHAAKMRKEAAPPIDSVVVGETQPADDRARTDDAVAADLAVLVEHRTRADARARADSNPAADAREWRDRRAFADDRFGVDAGRGVRGAPGPRKKRFDDVDERAADIVDRDERLLGPRHCGEGVGDDDDRGLRVRQMLGGTRRVAEREHPRFVRRQCTDCMNRPVRIADQRCPRQLIAHRACRRRLRKRAGKTSGCRVIPPRLRLRRCAAPRGGAIRALGRPGSAHATATRTRASCSAH
jgi:hypothetical protein